MTNEIYDELISGIPESLSVEELSLGRSWLSARLSDGGVGISAHFPGAFTGFGLISARDAAGAILSDDQERAAAGLAVINAYYNSPARLEAFRCRTDMDAVCTRGMDVAGKTVGMVGHMGRTARALGAAKKLYVFELDPRPGDLPAEEEPRLLPECDLVIMTGTVLINHTLPQLLTLCSGAEKILLGPSVPMCPALPVDRLSGAVITKPRDFSAWNMSSSGSPMSFAESFILDTKKLRP